MPELIVPQYESLQSNDPMLNAKLTQYLLLPYLPLPASRYLLSLENSITAENKHLQALASL